MKKVLLLMTVIAAMFLLYGCGKEKAAEPQGPQKVFEPEWYGIQDNPDYVYTFGKAEKKSENSSMTAATANAYQEAAIYVEAHVKTMMKNFEEEAGVENPEVTALTSNVTKVVANQKFSNTMLTKRDQRILPNGNYKAFVRISIPKAEVNKNMLNQIKREEALYNQFKASQAFQELDKELGSE